MSKHIELTVYAEIKNGKTNVFIIKDDKQFQFFFIKRVGTNHLLRYSRASSQYRTFRIGFTEHELIQIRRALYHKLLYRPPSKPFQWEVEYLTAEDRNWEYTDHREKLFFTPYAA